MTTPDLLSDLRAALARSVQEVKDDREHGASSLARRVAAAVVAATDQTPPALAAEALPVLHTALRDFASARPSMAAMANAAALIWQASLAKTGNQSKFEALANRARELVASDRNWQDATLQAARPVLTGPVFTHSRSASVENLLIAARRANPPLLSRVYQTTSQPGGEGIESARALANAGLAVTLMADAAMTLFVGDTNLVLVGADSIRPDGSVVNKVGTHTLALAAREADVPFYVVCETLKVAAPGFPLLLEEMDPRELLDEPIPGVEARNVYFDHTPAALVAGVITERGILHLPDAAQQAERAGEALTALLGHE